MRLRTHFQVRGRFIYGAMAFSPDGLWLATGSMDGSVNVWDPLAGKRVWNVGRHQSYVYTVGFGRDARSLVSGGSDGVCYFWDLRPPGTRADQDLARLWHDLAGEDGQAAYEAMFALSEIPDRAVAMLAENLRPVKTVIDLDRIAEGSSDEEAQRRQRLTRLLVERDPKVKLAIGVKRAVSLLAQLGTPDGDRVTEGPRRGRSENRCGAIRRGGARAIDSRGKAVNPVITSGYNRSRGASLIISSNPGRPMPLSVKTIVTIFLSMCSLSAAFGQVADRPSTPPTSAAPPRVDLEQAQVVARLEQHVPQLMKDGGVPGLAIALLRGGEVVWHRGFGVRNSKTKEPVDDATVFEAASLSKPVFAYAVLKLVDSGKFDLDKPLNQYLPGNYDVGDDPRLNQITARHVLSHTTGFPNWPLTIRRSRFISRPRRAVQLFRRGICLSLEGDRARYG